MRIERVGIGWAIAIGWLISLLMVVAVVWVAFHFIHKYW